jgi:hypothetical protein
MLLGSDFMPIDQIVNMSLNVLKRRVATHDKYLTWIEMDEYSITLYMGHWVSFIGAPMISFCFPEKHFLEDH